MVKKSIYSTLLYSTLLYSTLLMLSYSLLTATTILHAQTAKLNNFFHYISVSKLEVAAQKRLATVLERENHGDYFLFTVPDFDKLDQAQSIRFKVDGKMIIAEWDGKIFVRPTYFAWSGTIDGDQGTISLTINREGISGSLVYDNKRYLIERLAWDKHILLELIDDGPAINSCGTGDSTIPTNNTNASGSHKKHAAASIQGKTRIDALVAYTQLVAGSYNEQTLIDRCESTTNTAFSNSGVQIDLNVVHRVQVDYNEVKVQTDRDRFKSTSDGFMDEIHNLREQYRADICILLVKTSLGDDGAAYILDSVWNGFDYAFAAVKANVAKEGGYWTFAHEVGHLLNGKHQRAVLLGPYGTSHGYVYESGNWRTMMAVWSDKPNNCQSCVRLQYFSNPNIYKDGVAMGTNEYENAAGSLNLHRFEVAAYSNQFPPPPPPPTPPAKPTGFIITNATDVYMNPTMTWNAVSNANQYKVYRRFDYDTSWWNLATLTGTEFTDDLVTIQKNSNPNAFDIYYRITAINSVGESDPTASQSVWGDGLNKEKSPNLTRQNTFKLHLTNHPNPFNPSTEISYNLPRSGHVKLEIHNALGQAVATIDRGFQAPGKQRFVWHAQNNAGVALPSGQYFYRLIVQPVDGSPVLIKQKKMSLVR